MREPYHLFKKFGFTLVSSNPLSWLGLHSTECFWVPLAGVCWIVVDINVKNIFADFDSGHWVSVKVSISFDFRIRLHPVESGGIVPPFKRLERVEILKKRLSRENNARNTCNKLSIKIQLTWTIWGLAKMMNPLARVKS